MQSRRRSGRKNCSLAFTVAVLLAAGGCQSASYLRQRGVEAFEVGRYERAGKLLTTAAEKDPSNWYTHYYLGMAHLELSRPLEAQLELEMAEGVRPNNSVMPQILDGLAESIYQQGDSAALYALLTRACKDRGTTYDFLRQAKYLALIGDADSARSALRKATHFAPVDDVTPYLATADFYELIGDGPNAVMALRRALSIEPDSTNIKNRLRGHGVIPGPTIELAPEPR